MRELGIVKWFSTKGQAFGYILRKSGIEIFVHYRNISPDNQENPKFKFLAAGQKVSFVEGVGHSGSGTQALEVKIEIG